MVTLPEPFRNVWTSHRCYRLASLSSQSRRFLGSDRRRSNQRVTWTSHLSGGCKTKACDYGINPRSLPSSHEKRLLLLTSGTWIIVAAEHFPHFFFSLIFLSSCFSLYLRAENPQRDYWCVIFHLDNPVCFMHIYINLSLFSLLITWLTVLLPMAPDDLSSLRMKHQFRLNPHRLGTWPILFFFFLYNIL